MANRPVIFSVTALTIQVLLQGRRFSAIARMGGTASANFWQKNPHGKDGFTRIPNKSTDLAISPDNMAEEKMTPACLHHPRGQTPNFPLFPCRTDELP
ncbi:MAG: hypothetical protein Q4A06_02275 [Cardiobacteriaceae bacterium]|nr:hypothetical protein [Cardiobacteriaceae bacterium]